MSPSTNSASLKRTFSRWRGPRPQRSAARLVTLLAERNPDLPRDDLELAARQASAVFRGSLPLLGTVTGDEHRDTQELCTVIDAYLASRGID